VHVLHGDGGAHEAEQPAVEEALGHDSQFAHVVVQVVDPAHDDLIDVLGVHPQLFEVVQVDHAQLLVLHHLHQSPEGQTVVLYMVEQHPRDHVHALHVSHLNIVNAVGDQHSLQHLPELHILRKRWAFRMGPRQVFLYLDLIFLGRLLPE
jgi:hypothetical protein